MHLYNTLTQSLETFDPSGPEVTVYVCGITPYDTTHLGHAFTYAVYDILVRYLEHLGHTVRYAQNVTDIDDDILRKAKEEGEDWKALGDRWTVHFIEDLRTLNLRPPDYFPRATDAIAEIIQAVGRLLEAGVAYEAGGNVYFHIDAWPEFGKLSHIPRQEMLPIANERGNVPDDPRKRDPLDFVLWQAQKPGEPAWESPWGPGRPGWHIECSTLITKWLGETIDIHGGGADLAFPHHECGIAQVEPLTGKPFVRVWMHTAMVRYLGEKMSKSLGNLVMVRDLLQTHSPDIIRLYLAAHHYRAPWGHDERKLEQAQTLAKHLMDIVALPNGQMPLTTELKESYARDKKNFYAAMDNDLDFPKALSAIEDLAIDVKYDALAGYDVQEEMSLLRSLCSVFGLRLDAGEPEPRVVEGWNRHLAGFRMIKD
jgi:L-cysteine:1D-myo-inositol 2-amino-2-deoxy-alpha-D-glucopyranoside ligase